MKTRIASIFMSIGLLCSVSFAHVQNEYTIYDDMQYSNAKEELLQLRAAGIIPSDEGATVFTPQANLDTLTLNFWTSAFRTSTGQITEVVSENRPATYTDIVNAYLGKEAVQKPSIQALLQEKDNETVTKEDAVLFLGSLLEIEGGEGLLPLTNLTEGPQGIIESVAKTTVEDEKNNYDVYQITISGKAYDLSLHPKVLNGPVDIEKWKGKSVTRSWLQTQKEKPNDVPVIVYLEAKEDAFPASEYAPVVEEEQAHHKHEKTKEEENLPWVLIAGFSVVVLIGVVFLFTRKR